MCATAGCGAVKKLLDLPRKSRRINLVTVLSMDETNLVLALLYVLYPEKYCFCMKSGVIREFGALTVDPASKSLGKPRRNRANSEEAV